MNTTNTTNTINITTIESLHREARRRGFQVYGSVPPEIIIPRVEARIAQHNAADHSVNENSGDYIEWKQTMDDLQQFLATLRTLPARLPYENSAATGTATAPASHSNPSKNGLTHREKIEQLDKDIAERIAKLPASLQQELAAVGAPSDQASDPRRTPVPHPSNDASDASPDTTSAASEKPAPSSQSIEATIARERADYLAQLLRESSAPKSPIDDLPPERQQTLYQLTQDVPLTVVVKMIAAPEPVGWNFKTCDSSLRRFRTRYRKKLEAAERNAAFSEARSFLAHTAADEQSYMDAARRLLKIRLYKNAADPEGSDEQIELLIRLLDRQRRTDLAERRVRVAEQCATQKPEK